MFKTSYYSSSNGRVMVVFYHFDIQCINIPVRG